MTYRTNDKFVVQINSIGKAEEGTGNRSIDARKMGGLSGGRRRAEKVEEMR
jgi:hypothetical protein